MARDFRWVYATIILICLFVLIIWFFTLFFYQDSKPKCESDPDAKECICDEYVWNKCVQAHEPNGCDKGDERFIWRDFPKYPFNVSFKCGNETIFYKIYHSAAEHDSDLYNKNQFRLENNCTHSFASWTKYKGCDKKKLYDLSCKELKDYYLNGNPCVEHKYPIGVFAVYNPCIKLKYPFLPIDGPSRKDEKEALMLYLEACR